MADAAFEDIIGRLVVEGWHGAWRAARTRAQTHTDSFVTARDIGVDAWNALPVEERPDALGTLFDGYFKAMCDQDIRNSIEQDPDVGKDTAALRNAIEEARETGTDVVLVDAQSLARVLADLETWHIHRRHCPQYAEDEQDEDGATGPAG